MDKTTGQRKATDIVQEHLHAMEEKDFDKARKTLANDFLFAGVTPKPLSIDQYMEVHRHLFQGISGWRYNFNATSDKGDELTGTVRITGTHTGELTLPMMPDVGTVQATNKKISLPQETVHITCRGDRISRMDVQKVQGGGVMGILKQIGVDVHEHA